jgi:ribosomal protein S1
MIKEIDEKGRINLSIKAIDPDFATRKGLVASTQPYAPRTDHSSKPPRREH